MVIVYNTTNPAGSLTATTSTATALVPSSTSDVITSLGQTVVTSKDSVLSSIPTTSLPTQITASIVSSFEQSVGLVSSLSTGVLSQPLDTVKLLQPFPTLCKSCSWAIARSYKSCIQRMLIHSLQITLPGGNPFPEPTSTAIQSLGSSEGVQPITGEATDSFQPTPSNPESPFVPYVTPPAALPPANPLVTDFGSIVVNGTTFANPNPIPTAVPFEGSTARISSYFIAAIAGIITLLSFL